MSETRTDVIISGAGPNGLMLACELALAGTAPIVLDPLPGPSTEPKANGLVGQVVRLLDMRGLYPDLAARLPQQTFGEDLSVPQPISQYIFSGMRLDLAAVPNNPMYALAIPQPQLIQALTNRATELGVEIRWGHGLIELRQTESVVTAVISTADNTYELTAHYLVGADGGRSLVRKRLGIEFPGSTATNRITRFGHAQVPAELRTSNGGIEIPGAGRFHFGHNRLENGSMFTFTELIPGKPMIGVAEYGAEPVADDEPVTFEELRAAVSRVLGVDVPILPPSGPGPHALRRTVDQNSRLAERYRAGNVLLLGDAAHVHSAMGGPGLNLGLQDAINLGWKLAAEIHGWAPTDLLDTYQSERRPVGERVMMSSLSQSALIAPGPEVTALRDLFTELLELPQVADYLANLMAGSDVRYDTGDDHPLAGRLVPDFTIDTSDGTKRVAELLHDARAILLDLGAGVAEHAGGWSDRVRLVTGTSASAPAAALLIRPDGYVAWAATGSGAEGLQQALRRWFGPARSLTPAAH
jgi:2-polyprenyl-6-methoxyphenol hydroxylase-like FAD-dependent oxidoreductase